MNGLFLNKVLILSENVAKKLDLADISEIEYVVDGAELICDGCPGEKTNLQVTSQNDYEIKNKLVATKKDKETFENIPPFQSCIYNDNAKCEVIVEGDWENYIEDKFCGANQCLSKNSFARCQKGGIIRVIHSGQILTSETIATDSEELMKIASQGGTKEEIKKKLSEYLSKKYNQPMNVEDFKFTNGKFPTLDITTRGQMQNDFNKIELNKNLQTDVNEFNKNGIFFTERKAIQKVELLGNEYRVRETKDKNFPVRGVIYTDSSNYREKRGISKEIIEKTKKDWANEAEKRVKKKQESHNNIEWTKNIKEFNKKSDKWFDDLNVKIVDYKKNKDGSVTLVVDDFGNFLNKRENQSTIKEYEKNGIKFKNSIVGSYMSTEHAMQQYTIKQQYIRGFNYDDEYIDGKNIKSMYETYVGFLAAYGAMKSYRVMSGNKSKRKMSNGKTSELDIETRYKNARARYEESMNCDLYCKGTRCFAEGTFILTENGIKKIEEIKVGDKIYGYDEIKKENILKSVQAVYLHTTDLLVKIKTKKDIIFTTPEHPFYVNGQYILAGFLNTNMKLTDFEGKEVGIKEIEIIKYQKEQKVYNFSVEGTRNYYVGEERLLNHNLDDCIGRSNIVQNTEIPERENIHQKINSRGKEYYANLQADKKVEATTTTYKNFDHIVKGEIVNTADGGRGFKGLHSTINGAKVEDVSSRFVGGSYEAKVSMPDPLNNGNYLEKVNNGGRSTLFPDYWTENRIKVEIDNILKNPNNQVSRNKWVGTSSSQVKIKVFLNNNGEVTTAYPINPNSR